MKEFRLLPFSDNKLVKAIDLKVGIDWSLNESKLIIQFVIIAHIPLVQIQISN